MQITLNIGKCLSNTVYREISFSDFPVQFAVTGIRFHPRKRIFYDISFPSVRIKRIAVFIGKKD